MQVDLVLDINSELCQLAVKDTFKMVLAKSIALDEGEHISAALIDSPNT